ncbi:MAG: ATP-binding cassette domain-containing protein, partial [Gammaproteobacteria bacterium]|nr:ATP-binding cassette domain-containing protein [Gammaproteobacteria bacterium]
MSERSKLTKEQGQDIPRLELSNITKSFPGCLANDDVGLRVAPGEIHALLGENGAGKSTLVKIIYGLLRADKGSIKWQGKPIEVATPREARKLGIGMVFQHFSLFEALTVSENIALGFDAPGRRRELDERIVEISSSYGLPLDPSRGVHALSVGERQRIEVVRCLLLDPKLLIMDEPTSVLTPQEVEKLFETLRRLAAEGCSILYISHKLDEIKALCERATILRGGRVVNECDPRQETARSLAEMMIGSDLKTPAGAHNETGEAKLRVRNLSRPTEDDFAVALNDISFDVYAGEIFGIAGVAGNGQTELLEVLSGEVTLPSNDLVVLNEQPCGT